MGKGYEADSWNLSLYAEHGFTRHDPGQPPWPCPECIRLRVQELLHPSTEEQRQEEEERRQNREWIHNHAEKMRQRVHSAFGDAFGPRPQPGPRGATSSGVVRAIDGATPVRSAFNFNPKTAIHGEFKPGAEGWKPDQRSRRIRPVERNELRKEAAEKAAKKWVEEHPSGVTDSNLCPEARDFVPNPYGPNRGRTRARTPSLPSTFGRSLRPGHGARQASSRGGSQGP
ncbi:MAG: hypothetical protein Q9181_001691 [Wetmoreana brouardii]